MAVLVMRILKLVLLYNIKYICKNVVSIKGISLGTVQIQSLPRQIIDFSL